ncbi:MAG: tetratricopeptide repeat protein [Acidobacteriota bacterium]
MNVIIAVPEKYSQIEQTTPVISHWYIIGLILALTLLISAPALNYGFVYEDHALIENNIDIRHFDFVNSFRSSGGFTSGLGNDYQQIAFFRPLQTLLYSLNYQLFETDPFWWHLQPLIFYLTTVLLVYLISLRLLTDRYLAGALTLIFAWHPAHTEALAWAHCAQDPMHAMFYLSACYTFIRARLSARPLLWWTGALVSFALALLTKETAVSLPMVAAAYCFWLDNRDKKLSVRLRQSFITVLPFFFTLACYFVFRWLCFGGALRITNRVPWNTVLLTLPQVLLRYTINLLWPLKLSLAYPERYINSPAMAFFIPLLIILIIAIGLLVLAWRERRCAFALAWMVLTLGPMLNIGLFVPDMLLQDRYLFLPLFGFALLLVVMARTLITRLSVGWQRPALLFALAAVIGGYGVLMARQVSYWRDDIALFSRAIEVDARSGFAHFNLARAYQLQHNYEKALDHFQQAYDINPSADYFAALGDVYNEMGDYQTAGAYYNQVITQDPYGSLMTRNNLATIYLKLGRPELAVKLLTEGLNYAPNLFLSRYNLGLALLRTGEPARALIQLEQAERLNPDDPDTHALIREAHSAIMRKSTNSGSATRP